MPAYHVERSLEINAPSSSVYERIRDFHQWPAWSPWIAAEPDCSLEFFDDGNGYSWKGKIIGSGTIRVSSEVPNESLDLDLEFLPPHRAEAKIRFLISPTPTGSQVTWMMDGTLPFFLFWMKKMMTTFIGMDYENGLKLLKDLVELGKVPFHLNFAGLRDFPAQRLISISGESATDETLADSIGGAFNRFVSVLDNAGFTPEGPPITRYNKFDPQKNYCSFTIGFPYSGKLPPGLPPKITIIERSATRAYVVEHTGPYRHLGTAWSAAMQRARSKTFPFDKSAAPFEISINDPRTTPEEELVSHIYLPAK